jgi:predicted ArsR family transcriptional regulator
VWQLTAAGHAHFLDAHAELMAQFLRNFRSELGEEALDRLVAARERETRAHYTRGRASAGRNRHAARAGQ